MKIVQQSLIKVNEEKKQLEWEHKQAKEYCRKLENKLVKNGGGDLGDMVV